MPTDQHLPSGNTMNPTIGDLVAAVRSMPDASTTSLALCDALEEEGKLEFCPGRIRAYIMTGPAKWVWVGLDEHADEFYMDFTTYFETIAGIRWLDGRTCCEKLPPSFVGLEEVACFHEDGTFCCMLRILDNRNVKSNGPYTLPCKPGTAAVSG